MLIARKFTTIQEIGLDDNDCFHFEIISFHQNFWRRNLLENDFPRRGEFMKQLQNYFHLLISGDKFLEALNFVSKKN